MHPNLWGRAESIRVMLRKAGEAVAPLLFGYLVTHVFGDGASGLGTTFEVMMIPMFVSGFIALVALRTYPRDVATAEAYADRTMGGGAGGRAGRT